MAPPTPQGGLTNRTLAYSEERPGRELSRTPIFIHNDDDEGGDNTTDPFQLITVTGRGFTIYDEIVPEPLFSHTAQRRTDMVAALLTCYQDATTAQNTLLQWDAIGAFSNQLIWGLGTSPNSWALLGTVKCTNVLESAASIRFLIVNEPTFPKHILDARGTYDFNSVCAHVALTTQTLWTEWTERAKTAWLITARHMIHDYVAELEKIPSMEGIPSYHDADLVADAIDGLDDFTKNLVRSMLDPKVSRTPTIIHPLSRTMAPQMHAIGGDYTKFEGDGRDLLEGLSTKIAKNRMGEATKMAVQTTDRILTIAEMNNFH